MRLGSGLLGHEGAPGRPERNAKRFRGISANFSRPECVFVPMKLSEFGRWLYGNADGFSQERLQSFNPQNLALENSAEIARDRLGDLLDRNHVAKLTGYGRDRLINDSTRNNEVKIAEIRVYVQSETVRGHGTRDMDADGCDFCLFFWLWAGRLGRTGFEWTGGDARRSTIIVGGPDAG